MAETKKCNKKALVAVGILVVVLAAMAAVFFIFRPKPAEGSKSITIEVINSANESKMYELNTDAEYLRQAMEEAKGLKFSGTESEFGLTLITVNGEDTDFEYLDCIEYQGTEYLVLLPCEEEASELVILQVEPVDEEHENYLAVEDEAVMEAVYGIFKEKFQDVMTFAD